MDSNVGFLDPLRSTVEVVHGDVRQVIPKANARFQVLRKKETACEEGRRATWVGGGRNSLLLRSEPADH